MYKYLLNINLINLIKKLVTYLEEEQLANKLLRRLEGIILEDEAIKFNHNKEMYLLQYLIKNHTHTSHLKVVVETRPRLGSDDLTIGISLVHNIFGVLMQEKATIYETGMQRVDTYKAALKFMIDKIVKHGLDHYINTRRNKICGPYTEAGIPKYGWHYGEGTMIWHENY